MISKNRCTNVIYGKFETKMYWGMDVQPNSWCLFSWKSMGQIMNFNLSLSSYRWFLVYNFSMELNVKGITVTLTELKT